ncbi:hypothetical protein PYW08_016027 [Mythimna loreyi]|uniref:Uncharacterized protein n=1 Tax=Mythimna loreyi TaxID=667449 RepID=A0ACC2QSC8_9NEOP|nr:hypothetical protein PYW08_016027 [Mythimna loreyi]
MADFCSQIMYFDVYYYIIEPDDTILKVIEDTDMLQESLPGPFGGRNELKYITRKGGIVLLHDGYQFVRKITYKNGAIVWECYLRKKTKCTGTMTIKENQIIKKTSHSCIPDFDKNLVESYMDNCKKKKSSRPIFSTTSRGARVLIIAGFKFYRHRITGSKIRWACATSGGCKAVVYTIEEEEIVRCVNVHSHPPPIYQIDHPQY